MSHFSSLHGAPDCLTAYFKSGEVMRSRNVGAVVHADRIDVPSPPTRLLADWDRETSSRLGLAPGDVESLPLARARARWPDYRQCVQAMTDWVGTLGLAEVLAASDVALMASRGARYHHDAAQYGGAAFCNLFLSEDQGLDVHFPLADLRIPLVRGTVMVFDTGQPHAVIPRGRSGFDAADFAAGREGPQVFLTWELPLEDARVAHALGVAFDVDPPTASRLDEEQLWLNGAPAAMCPASGRWLAPAERAA
jgi:hypothetical protein